MIRALTWLWVLIFPFFVTGCVLENHSNSNYSRGVVIEERNIEDFNRIKLEGTYSVLLKNADTCRLSIAADDAIRPMIVTHISSGLLSISTHDGAWNSKEEVELVISVNDLQSIETLASAKLTSDDIFTFDHLMIDSKGVLKMNMDLHGNKLEGKFSGASDLNLKGNVSEVSFIAPGACKISAYDLKTQNFTLDLSGAGKAEVFASRKLEVHLSGACVVSYKGSPSEVFSNVSGLGRVKEAR
jgi:hypothetical protein